MKKLKVPYLVTLDVLDLSSVGFLLENKAQREYIDVINWEEYPYKPIVAFDIARTDENLYIRYFVKGNSLKAVHSSDGSPVYTDSCVEFFMKTVDDHNYMNFEFNCIGTCDAARRQSRDIKRSLNTDEYTSIRHREQTFFRKDRCILLGVGRIYPLQAHGTRSGKPAGKNPGQFLQMCGRYRISPLCQLEPDRPPKP